MESTSVSTLECWIIGMHHYLLVIGLGALWTLSKDSYQLSYTLGS